MGGDCLGNYVAIALGVLLAIVSTVLVMFLSRVYCKSKCHKKNAAQVVGEREDQSDASTPYFSTRGASQQQSHEKQEIEQDLQYASVGMSADGHGGVPNTVYQQEDSARGMSSQYHVVGDDFSQAYALPYNIPHERQSKKVPSFLYNMHEPAQHSNHSKFSTASRSAAVPMPQRVVYKQTEQTYDETPEDIGADINMSTSQIPVEKPRGGKVKGHSSCPPMEKQNQAVFADYCSSENDFRPEQTQESLYSVAEEVPGAIEAMYEQVRK